MPWTAQAAGLGKITVFSGLGQPLRAELEIAANKDEVAGMAARLAPPDSFSQAGIDYASVLRDLRFVVEKRGNGQPVVKVSSIKPINEPFLDFLVELNWPAGRLVREYTFLLDPPEITAKGSATPVSTAEAQVVETVRGGGASQVRRAPPVKAAPAPAPAPAPAAKVAAAPAKADAAGTHVVQSGETLRKIAAANQYQGVSLEQMLVGLYQGNPDAFIGQNINRLKAGAILGIPEKAAVEAVSEAEARKVYVAHASDWNAYRRKLAAGAAKAPAREETAAQATSGKITAKVEEKATPVEQSKDQVKVSRTEAAAKGALTGKAAANEADQIAKDKALKDAQGRLASLEKNVDELQKLLEMKNKKLAELQQPVKKEEVKAVEPPKPVEVAKPAEPVKPVEPAKAPEVVKPVEPVPPVEAPKPAEVKPVAQPKSAEPVVAPVPAPEVEEPGFLDSLTLGLLGGGGVLALIAGYLLAKRRRQHVPAPETTTAPSPSSLGPNSVFRMTGGQSIDTTNTAPHTGDFSQTGPGSIDTDEVDPVAEADVYMAYGRDTQAEEILLEALQKDPQRTAIHAKLLEIYANRKSAKQFETLASELYAQTAGVGPEWEKVAEMGAALDPENPLYSGARLAVTAAVAADAAFLASESFEAPEMPEHGLAPAMPEELPLADIGDTLLLSEMKDLPLMAETPEEAPEDLMSLDFDLAIPEPVVAAAVAAVPVEAPAFDEPYIDTVVTGEGDALDFDLGAAEPVVEVASEPVGETPRVEELANDIVDFDFDLEAAPAEAEKLVAQEAIDTSPDFSPEGTMVMHSGGIPDDAISTYIGVEAAPTEAVAAVPERPAEKPMEEIDFDLGSASTQTLVNPIPAGMDSEFFGGVSFAPEIEVDNPQLAATVVGPDTESLEFDVSLTDSVFLGQPMVPPDFDIGSINLDLAAEPAQQPAVTPAAEVPPTATPVASPEVAAAEDAAKDAHWEQVNTKLDLAKAYEEMGDLEGARELLQEVVGEGSSDLVEQAHAILGRIGE